MEQVSYEVLLREAPEEEPNRQLYFIEKCKEFMPFLEERLGHRPRSCVQTFGCQMNARDSEKLRGILAKIGYEETEHEEDADLILYNTCTVREKADNRVYGRLGYLSSLKRQNPDLIVGVCGCMVQEKSVLKQLKEEYSFVDLLFGTYNVYELAELLYLKLRTGQRMISVLDSLKRMVEDLPTERFFPFKAGVTIMIGCNNFCTFCIVPYVRGREKSRPHAAILKEIEDLARDGVKEVMLLGQNVNSYGKDAKGELTFPELLQEVEKIDGIERIRFMTSHPKDLSPQLIEVMKNSKKICKHFHLPVQSGSDRILKDMNRHYTKEDYLKKVDALRAAIPDISLTTDIIVGFPGETEEDFQDTLDIVRYARYEAAYTFQYSPRSGTKAAKREDQVDPKTVKDRFDRLLAVIQEIGREENKKREGTVEECLIEEKNEREEGLLTARLSSNTLVHVKGDLSLLGTIQKVRLDKAMGFYYLGSLADE